MKTFGKGKKTMKILKKIGLFLLDFIEVFMPVAALTITFVSFIANVIARYIVGSPLNASYELCLTGLLWCLLLSAPYAVRKDNNVKFTLVYDRLNGAGQMAFRLLGNGFMIFCLGIMLYPCADWVMFMARKSTAVLRIPMHIIYFPFIVFNVLALGHLIYDFVRDVILLIRAIRGKEPLQKKRPEGNGAEGGESV